MGKKAKKTKLQVFSGWYPFDSNFRAEFNEAMRATIMHAGKHGDTSLLERLLVCVSGTEPKRFVMRKIVSSFPFQYDLKAKRLKVKKGAVGDMPAWQDATKFDVFVGYTSISLPKPIARGHRKTAIDLLSDAQEMKRQAKCFEAAGRHSDAVRLLAEARTTELKGRRVRKIEQQELT